jgi:hypothetical protein
MHGKRVLDALPAAPGAAASALKGMPVLTTTASASAIGAGCGRNRIMLLKPQDDRMAGKGSLLT